MIYLLKDLLFNGDLALIVFFIDFDNTDFNKLFIFCRSSLLYCIYHYLSIIITFRIRILL